MCVVLPQELAGSRALLLRASFEDAAEIVGVGRDRRGDGAGDEVELHRGRIVAQPDGMYVVDGRSYYLQLDDAGPRPVVRQTGERQELIVPVKGKLAYSILF